jgi:hypothetical protein
MLDFDPNTTSVGSCISLRQSSDYPGSGGALIDKPDAKRAAGGEAVCERRYQGAHSGSCMNLRLAPIFSLNACSFDTATDLVQRATQMSMIQSAYIDHTRILVLHHSQSRVDS